MIYNRNPQVDAVQFPRYENPGDDYFEFLNDLKGDFSFLREGNCGGLPLVWATYGGHLKGAAWSLCIKSSPEIRLDPGDWLIVDNEKFYTMDDATFSKIYRKATDD